MRLYGEKGCEWSCAIKRSLNRNIEANIQTSDLIFWSFINNLKNKYLEAILVDCYYE